MGAGVRDGAGQAVPAGRRGLPEHLGDDPPGPPADRLQDAELAGPAAHGGWCQQAGRGERGGQHRHFPLVQPSAPFGVISMLWGSWAPCDGAVLGGTELTNVPVTVTSVPNLRRNSRRRS